MRGEKKNLAVLEAAFVFTPAKHLLDRIEIHAFWVFDLRKENLTPADNILSLFHLVDSRVLSSKGALKPSLSIWA